MKGICIVLLCLPVVSLSQSRFQLSFMGGFANYQGDLQSKRYTTSQSNLAFGAGLRYELTNKIALRSGFNIGSLSASDKENKATLKPRNLSFQTRLIEWNLLAEYTFFDLSEKRIAPYVFGGIALYNFNPYTRDTLGNKIFLRPLSTEGQGLAQYPQSKNYSLTQFAIPLGAGVKFRVTDRAVLGFEIGMRKLFTDYLDDVSMNYVDPAILLQERGPKAVEMSYRGGELKDGNPIYPTNEVRGGSKFKDWYYFSGLTLSIGLNGGSGFNSGGRNNTGCPVNVF